MELVIKAFPKCKCGGDLIPLFDHQQATNELYIKGWYCIGCNKFFLLSAGEVRWKEGKAWIDKKEEREF